ncbi:MAG: hypothetical protein JNN08_13780 [Bryobacterales bacterium]|nr:hypothetical protein [Bryobacterales bacterium]
MATHALHTEWKNIKARYATEIKTAKINFNKGLGPQLDIMASKPNTEAAAKASLKVHQYCVDYAGNKYCGSSSLSPAAKKDMTVVLNKIKAEALKVGMTPLPKKK